MTIKEQIISQVNNFMKENLEEDKMVLLMNGIEFDKLFLTDIYWTKEETNKHSIGYQQYWVFRHVFKADDKQILLDVDRYNTFQAVYLAYNYDISWDSDTGTEIEDDNIDEEDFGLMKLLNNVNFADFITNNSLIDDFEIEEINRIANQNKADFLNELPGIVDILPHTLDEVQLVLSNGVKLRVPTREIDYGIHYNRTPLL